MNLSVQKTLKTDATPGLSMLTADTLIRHTGTCAMRSNKKTERDDSGVE
jgi:hypothetical protein